MLGFWQGRPPYPTTASSSLLRPPLISSALSPCLNFTSFVTFHSTSILHTISLHLPISKSFSLNSYLLYVTGLQRAGDVQYLWSKSQTKSPFLGQKPGKKVFVVWGIRGLSTYFVRQISRFCRWPAKSKQIRFLRRWWCGLFQNCMGNLYLIRIRIDITEIYLHLSNTYIEQSHLVLQSLHVLLFQSMNMFIIIFALFAYLTKIFSSWSHHPTLFGVKSNSRAALILKLISTLLSFYTFPQKTRDFFVFITSVFFWTSVMNQGLIFSWELGQLWEL